MKRLILILLVSTFLVGCGKSRPTYQLMVGTRTVTLVVHEDPKRIQDDLDVPADLIARHTPASPVAETMARNCRQRWGADYALAIGGFPVADAAAAEPPAVYFAIAGAGRADEGHTICRASGAIARALREARVEYAAPGAD